MTEIIVVTAWRGNHFSKYGDIYFINGGGNHRVCQAKFLGIETVQCEVTEFVIEKVVLPGVTPVLHKQSIRAGSIRVGASRGLLGTSRAESVLRRTYSFMFFQLQNRSSVSFRWQYGLFLRTSSIHVRGNIGSLACVYVRIYDSCTISRCIIDMTGGVLEEEIGLWQIWEIWPVRVPKFEKVIDEFC